MMLDWSQFHFLRPAWFLALLPVMIAVYLLWRRGGNGGNWRQVCDTTLLPYLLLNPTTAVQRLPFWLLAMGWVLAVIALAGPTWQQQPQPAYRTMENRVILLDLSASMVARDLQPSRIERAKFKLRDILSRSQEGRTGLVVFAGEPHVVTPLTDDTATIEAMLPALSVGIVPAPGDKLAPALKLAAQLLGNAGESAGDILILSDGFEDAAGALAAASELSRRGLSVSLIGVGTEQAVPLPDDAGRFQPTADGSPVLSKLDAGLLKQLAQTGAGSYVRIAADDRDLQRVLTPINRAGLAGASRQDQGVEHWFEQGYWLLLPLLLLAALGFRRGWVLTVYLALLFPPPPVYAFDWSQLWLNSDQRAARALAEGDAAQAAELFKDPDWQSVARYKNGEYEQAIEGFAAGTEATTQYNRGNALARAGRLQEALDAYESALKQTPGDEDTHFNRDLVKSLLQQQQDQQQDQQQSDSEQQSSDESGQAQKDAESQSGSQESEQKENKDSAESEENQQSAQNDASDSPEQQGQEQSPSEQAAQNETSEQKEQAAAKPDDSQAKDNNANPAQAEEQGQPPGEQDLALEQWLREVPDDPGGLLRRKFRLEHLRRRQGQ